ncbi:MAG: hypothetical protein WAW90_02875 [Minisyncoccia bacterium]
MSSPRFFRRGFFTPESIFAWVATFFFTIVAAITAMFSPLSAGVATSSDAALLPEVPMTNVMSPIGARTYNTAPVPVTVPYVNTEYGYRIAPPEGWFEQHSISDKGDLAIFSPTVPVDLSSRMLISVLASKSGSNVSFSRKINTSSVVYGVATEISEMIVAKNGYLYVITTSAERGSSYVGVVAKVADSFFLTH